MRDDSVYISTGFPGDPWYEWRTDCKMERLKNVSPSIDGSSSTVTVKYYNDDFKELKDSVDKLQNQINETLFTDEVLEVLLHDKIIETANQVKEDIKRDIKKKKIRDINNFTKAIYKVIFTKKKETIVLWKDGTKTIVTCQEGDEFDKEKGLALCIIKYIFGNIGEFNNIFKAFDFDSDESQIEPKTK